MAGRATRINCVWARALRGRCVAAVGLLARPDSPRRCTLPITALRVMPPSSAAIWLAERPSPHNFFRLSTRSSVQVMRLPPTVRRRTGRDRIHPRPGPAMRPTRRLLPATDELRNLSAARNVVPDNQDATIWREAGARVRISASTLFHLEFAGIHTYLHECGGRGVAGHLRATPRVDVPRVDVDRQAGRNRIDT